MPGRCAPYLILLAEVLVFYRRVLFSGKWVIPYDLPEFHLPLATTVVQSLAAGEFPWWDPYTYCGFPFSANLQTQLFYPGAWPGFVAGVAWGAERMQDILEWQVALHVWLGGALAFRLSRALGGGAPAAMLAGTIYGLGAFFTSQAQHLGAVCGMAWLPLAWLAVWELRTGWSARWVAWLAVAMAMMGLAGFPAAACAGVVSTLVVAALAGRSAVAGISAASVWALALAAVAVFPAIELTLAGTAWERGQWGGEGGGMSWRALVSLVAPNYYSLFDLSRFETGGNPTFLYLYGSVTGLALAVCGIARRLPWVWVTIGCGLAMMGSTTPLGAALYRWIPDAVKSPFYAEFFLGPFALGFSVLAGAGVSRVLPARLAWAAVAVAAGELIWAGSGRPLNTLPSSAMSARAPGQFEGSEETLRRVRQRVESAAPGWRVEAVKDSMYWAAGAAVLKVPSANGNDPLALRRYLAVRRLFAEGAPWMRYWEVSRPDSRVLDLVGVRYIVSYEGSRVPGEFPLVERLPGHEVRERPRALARFFLVSETRAASDAIEAVRMMDSAEFDPGRWAVVEDAGRRYDGGGTLRVVRYEPALVELEVHSKGPAFLVSSEVMYPGWQCQIDGDESELVMTNGSFRGVRVEAGTHTVRMWFRPRWFWLWAAVSAVAWAVLAVRLEVEGRAYPPQPPSPLPLV